MNHRRFMLRILSVVLIVMTFGLCLPAFAVVGTDYYFDSDGGSDLNSGKTPAEAFHSASLLGSLELEPGDRVLFKSGCTFQCSALLTVSGTEDNPIAIASYGVGEKPILETQGNTEVLRLFDCSYVTVENLEITAPNGGGMWIDTLNEASVGVTVRNIVFHNIQNTVASGRDNLSNGAAGARACIMVKGLPARSRYAVNDLTISGCEMYDCGNGISIWGSWNDAQSPWCENEEDIDPVYNTGTLVENCFFHDMDEEAVIVGICDGALVTNCRAIDCCQNPGTDENGKVLFYTAAMWFWGSENSIIEYCEIAGQKNAGDGMAVDFDSHTNNCTYQFIYSHDNTRFMNNCPIGSGQHGNTVRYCLSVNDNKAKNKAGGSAGEYDLSFYNNTVINGSDFNFEYAHDGDVSNNIFNLQDGCGVLFGGNRTCEVRSNCYYNAARTVLGRETVCANPQFTGGGEYDPESYTLQSSSPCIGTGANKFESAVKTDMFGNLITNNQNIGCYAGTGTQPRENERYTLIDRLVNFLKFIYRQAAELAVHDWNWLMTQLGKA